MSGLALADVGVRYGDAAVLAAVSLAVAPGEIVALVGASGSGKSTLARAAVGLLPVAAVVTGRVTLDGRPFAAADRGRGIALLPQDPAGALNGARTIGSQIGEVLPRRGRAAAVAAALARVGLDVPPDRYPHALSGGQRARAALAAALAAAPAILLADEPTAALDPAARAALAALLRHLVRAERLGLLLVTHDLALARGLADRVAVLDGGRIVEEGAPAILDRPASPALRALGAAGDLPPPPAAAPGRVLLAMRDVTRVHRTGWRDAGVVGAAAVALEVRAGETLALVGPSGAGKSTLVRLALGLDRADAGSVRLGGIDPARPGRGRRAVRRLAQAVFQDPATSFDPRWRVGEVVAEPLGLLDGPADAPARVAAALAAVELDPAMAARDPATLSGGQRQRVALARALVIAPALVVLDEALSALDLATRAGIVRLLLRLQAERGLAYLLVAHDPALVRALAHRVARVEGGRVVATGAPSAILGEEDGGRGIP